MRVSRLKLRLEQAVRPLFLTWNIVVVLVVAALCFSSHQVAAFYGRQAAIATPDLTTASQTVATSGVVSNTASSAKPIQTCVPHAKTPVTALDISTDPAGLRQQIDAPVAYQIFGDTAEQLRAQVQRCAPKEAGTTEAAYTGETSYQMNWLYRYAEIRPGVCQVNYAAVGLHVTQTMPKWTPTASARAGLARDWNNFMSALRAHEDGHTALDIQYAQTLLSDLQNFPPTPCDRIAQSLRHLADSDVTALAQANDNYDTTTDHGATQGAILP